VTAKGETSSYRTALEADRSGVGITDGVFSRMDCLDCGSDTGNEKLTVVP